MSKEIGTVVGNVGFAAIMFKARNYQCCASIGIPFLNVFDHF
jgi:hypothetical protein